MVDNPFAVFLDMLQKTQQVCSSPFSLMDPDAMTSVQKALYVQSFTDFSKIMEYCTLHPERLAGRMAAWWDQQIELLQHPEQAEADPRFSAPEWNQGDIYSYVKAYYLVLKRTVENTLNLFECDNAGVNQRVKFFSRQLINALSPANFIFTNPEVTSLTLETQGQNLVNGLHNLMQDMQTSSDVLNISQVNKNAYTLGEDIAATPGTVVYRNELCEVIQYHPRTKTVKKTPLLIVPPLINKYYILDLGQKSSMVRWLLDKGHPLFMISWRNPDASFSHTGFEDYVLNGVVKAVSVIESITGVDQIDAAGYCIGGTLLAVTVAWYAARRMKKRIRSASYFTTLLDFSSPGDLGAYIEPSVFSVIDEQNTQRGFMDGRMLNVTFNSLRENTLYWNYFTSNYLEGKTPGNFELLFWSNDSMNVSAACWRDIVDRFYMKNLLAHPRSYKVGGVFIDLSKVDVPAYFISTRDDHIALWQGTYKGAHLFRGKTTFVLGNSGHVAGIINPPSKRKYGYLVNASLPDTPESWLAGAETHEGSWWEHWHDWLQHQEKTAPVAPYPVGNETYPALLPAPGTYVLETV